MNRSETIGKLMAALLQAQTEFDPVLKDTRNPLYNSKYAELSGVIAATQPALSKNGLVISQLAISDLEHQGSGVTTILAHSSGEFLSEDFLLPATGHGKDGAVRYDAQSACGAVTYARRYTYLAIIGIAAEDDDGNTAAGQRNQPYVPRPSVERPDFQEAQRATPKPQPPPPAHSTQAPTAAPAVPERIPGTPITVAPPITEPQLTEQEKRETVDTLLAMSRALNSNPTSAPEDPKPAPLPTEEDMKAYRNTFKLLGDDLTTEGKLKSSRGLPVNRKILVYLLYVTGATDAKVLTKAQWDSFFGHINAIKASPDGLKTLAALIDQANGIEAKT